MAFKNGLSERLDELRFPSPRSPPSETPFPGYNPLSPGHSTFVSAFSRPSGDVRGNLQRRFTTDASKLSSWSYLNNVGSTPQMPDALDLLSSFEKKRQHIEYMREQKRRFEEDMKLFDMQHEREQQEMDQLAKDLAKAGISGPVSEPTTPPEYRENGFPGGFSRPTRFSTSSVTSSPGFFNVFAPSVTSPPSQPSHDSVQTPTNRFAVHSVPGSRRNSEKEDFGHEPTSPFRPGPSIHRYSMPATGLGSQIRPNISGFNNSSGLESFNAAKYLLHHDDDRSTLKDEDRIPTPDIKSYLKLTEPDDKFPTLSRREDSGLLSANSDALDLANSRTPNPESWNSHNRHRSSHQSMPQNALNMFRLGQIGGSADEGHTNASNNSRHAARHSLEANILYSTDGNHDAITSTSSSRPAPLQSSYSTNDLPTVKGEGFNPAITPPKTHAEQFQQHNVNLGRIPINTASTRPQKDSPEREEANLQSSRAQATTLQPSATPFGPQITTAATSASSTTVSPTSLTTFQAPFYGYGIQPYMGTPMQVNGQLQGYNPSPSFSGYPPYSNYRLADNPAKSVGSRRNGDGDSAQLSRFTNFPLEHYRGELYGLCKDQHGCRYLQRKLEERNAEHVQMIFDETNVHVVELMTDPFGNYLCQKLLEYSNDEQRTALINNAAHQLVKIALNQHGTRALQKMIEFISTSEQTQTVIHALRDHVVELVQDLNGNHVIQKCLNRLSAEDAQFIYDAVGGNCVVVGTHRHGCCVLQRCIDHASGEQRARLIAQITSNAFALVQDPFGNYVVQYILDLAEPHFTEPLCQAFRGNIPALSKQKFSSNVIEKCLRTAEMPIRRQMIEEMLSGVELEKMLRDSFANYVVQTAMDFADPELRNTIVESVRPILPSIRQTPHGRRIAGKMMASESSGRGSAATSGQVTPNEMNSAQLPGPLQTPQKSFLYQHAFPVANGGGQFGSQNFVPASGTGSSSNTPSGASENSSGIFSATTQQQNGTLGAQNQLYAYF
ncbi:RNA-binding protein [Aspergillus ochraceoroseus]|uniref:RNA-binding protein n=1 Tax=Aspergillus ochraceoroseus TaxID=138278 RepID=A0A0F8VNV8_9EURO|nr:RNA-binding protein [Aspergillus ochraceoroseus]